MDLPKPTDNVTVASPFRPISVIYRMEIDFKFCRSMQVSPVVIDFIIK